VSAILTKLNFFLDRVRPRVEVGGEVGVAAIDRLADEIERHRLPGDVRLGVDARLGERDLECDLRRRADAIGCDRLALDAGDVGDARGLGSEQALAAAVRADEQLDVEALFERLQPIADQPGAGVGLAGRQRLDQRLPAGALIEEFDVEIVLGVDALGDAETERRMAGRHFGPGEAHLGRGAGDGGREHARSERAGRGGDAQSTDSLEDATTGNGLVLGLVGHWRSPEF
jgi:hypothetical protein